MPGSQAVDREIDSIGTGIDRPCTRHSSLFISGSIAPTLGTQRAYCRDRSQSILGSTRSTRWIDRVSIEGDCVESAVDPVGTRESTWSIRGVIALVSGIRSPRSLHESRGVPTPLRLARWSNRTYSRIDTANSLDRSP
jgi:hypothetical protein